MAVQPSPSAFGPAPPRLARPPPGACDLRATLSRLMGSGLSQVRWVGEANVDLAAVAGRCVEWRPHLESTLPTGSLLVLDERE